MHVQVGLLSGLMMKIYGEFRHLDSASPVAIQGLTMEMCAAVFRDHSNLSGRQRQRWFARGVEFLRESFTEHLTLAQVPSAAGVHKVWRKITFPFLTTTKVRVTVNRALAGFSRIVELEVWG